MDDTRALQQLIQRFRRRAALSSALRSALAFILWAALTTLVLITIVRIAGLSRRAAFISFGATPLVVAAGAIRGLKRSSTTSYAAAKQLDAELKLNDRLANAHYFLSVDAVKRSPMADLAIADGIAAAGNAKLSALPPVGWTRRATYGVLGLLLCGGWTYLLYPPIVIPADQAIAQETREEVKDIIKSFQDLPGMSAEQKEDVKKMLETLNISEDEMNKMTRADLMRVINSKVAGYKGSNAKAFEAIKDAFGELDAIRKEHEEIERKNKEAYQINLANGQKVTGVRIATQAPTESIIRDKVQMSMGIKQAGESDELNELQKQTELAAESARNIRSKIGLKSNAAINVDTAALLSTNENYKKDTETAIQDPNSEAAQRVRKAQRDVLQRELEKGELPSGTAEKLKNWMTLDKQ